MPTTWNPADVSAKIALSAGNHTATSTTGSGNEGGRSTTSKTAAGKWYVEFTGIVTGGNGFGIGLGSASESLTDNSLPAFRLGDDGHVFAPPGTYQPGWGAPVGKTVSMAFDFSASPPRGWVRYDAGAWFGPSGTGADPTTASTGWDLSSIGGFPTFLKFWLQFSAHTVTLNAGDSAFLQSMPAGYQGWDSVPPPAFSRALFVGA